MKWSTIYIVGVVNTLAGSPSNAFADGPSSSASFYVPSDITIDSLGHVFVADTANHRIRKISSSGNFVVHEFLF